MISDRKSIAGIFMLVVLGFGAAYVLRLAHSTYGYNDNFSDILIKYLFPSGLVISGIGGFLLQKTPWYWPATLLSSFYLGTLFLLPGAGQLLPIELIIMAIIGIPYSVASYAGYYLHNFLRNWQAKK